NISNPHRHVTHVQHGRRGAAHLAIQDSRPRGSVLPGSVHPIGGSPPARLTRNLRAHAPSAKPKTRVDPRDRSHRRAGPTPLGIDSDRPRNRPPGHAPSVPPPARPLLP